MSNKLAYEAVYAVIDELGSTLPPDPAHRNAMIWKAVAAALNAPSGLTVERAIREAARHVDDDSRALGMMDAADMIRQARTS
ncbi:hypothetical protein KGD82_13480 [Nocardiopsis eucommiae]|uniref:Uncharacterized protein n=1 Tax=Nocardiopsis eucommiae TaxID=2831970 RepID=A0A975LCD2_9ACTN|nr:hypothetical protein KGD82_13480 [Nocardiopsis eucommiae]